MKYIRSIVYWSLVIFLFVPFFVGTFLANVFEGEEGVWNRLNKLVDL